MYAEKRPRQPFVLPRFFIRVAPEKKGEKMKNKKLLIALIALVVVAAAMVGIMIATKPKPKDPDPTTAGSTDSVLLACTISSGSM